MDRSVWAGKYMSGGITGFSAASIAWSVGGINGLLGGASVVTVAALWYYEGRSDETEEQLAELEALKRLVEKGSPNA